MIGKTLTSGTTPTGWPGNRPHRRQRRSRQSWIGKRRAYRYARPTAAGNEADEILAEVPTEQRVLVTSHDSLGYFADRFGFTVIATVIPGGGTLAEPSGREIAELVDTIDTAGVSVVLADTSNPTAITETVAAEAGGDVSSCPDIHRLPW